MLNPILCGRASNLDAISQPKLRNGTASDCQRNGTNQKPSTKEKRPW